METPLSFYDLVYVVKYIFFVSFQKEKNIIVKAKTQNMDGHCKELEVLRHVSRTHGAHRYMCCTVL